MEDEVLPEIDVALKKAEDTVCTTVGPTDGEGTQY